VYGVGGREDSFFMRRHLLASTGILALLTATSVNAAKAADMPLKAPPLVVAPWSWSGLYLGAHAGFGSARDSFADPFFAGKVPVTLGGIDPHGFLGGFQAGANWQTGSWVGGLEIDLSRTGIKGTSSVASPTVAGTFDSATQTDRFDLLGSARARVGYLPVSNVLLYGTGGLAWTRFDQTTTSMATSDAGGGTFVGIITATEAPSWRFGWVAGLGAEVRLWDSNWLARLEYLHYDFGDSGNAFATGSTPTTSSHLTTDVVRVGLSYLFGGGLVPAAPAAYSPMVFKAPAAAVAWSWSGFYIGAHAGYGWGNDPQLNTPFDENFDLTPTEPLSGVDSHGGLGGFQAGAN
jgi:opacity protein-like surface antigen